jgi:hypothetical protein
MCVQLVRSFHGLGHKMSNPEKENRQKSLSFFRNEKKKWEKEKSYEKREIKNQRHSCISHQMKVVNVGLQPNKLIKD